MVNAKVEKIERGVKDQGSSKTGQVISGNNFPKLVAKPENFQITKFSNHPINILSHFSLQ